MLGALAWAGWKAVALAGWAAQNGAWAAVVWAGRWGWRRLYPPWATEVVEEPKR